MPSKIEVLRRQYRSVALGAMGRPPRSERTTESELGWDGADHLLLALPADIAAYGRLQDPATGEFMFQFDVSAFDGPDPWA